MGACSTKSERQIRSFIIKEKETEYTSRKLQKII